MTNHSHSLRWTVRVEWKPQDCWIGVFWKRDVRFMESPKVRTLDIWICLVPMLPIHVNRTEPIPEESLQPLYAAVRQAWHDYHGDDL